MQALSWISLLLGTLAYMDQLQLARFLVEVLLLDGHCLCQAPHQGRFQQTTVLGWL